MDLLEALGIRKGERVALTGAGGKTSLAYLLVNQAQARGWRAMFSTTTKVLAPENPDASFVIGAQERDLPELRQLLQQQGRLFLVRGWAQEWDHSPAGRQQKLGGFSPEEMDRLAEALQPDLLVVEADGSRHRSFKAPADHEPVIPAGTTLVVVLVGLSILGRPLEADWVHRPELAAALAQVPAGTTLDPAIVARVLAHPQGGRKGCPEAARTVAMLTQTTAACRPAGRSIARRLLHTGAYPQVLLVNLDEMGAPVETWQQDGSGYTREGPAGSPQVQAVVLAAGRSQRMGQNKLLLPLAGKPLLAHAVDAALGSRAAAVWVVLGRDADQVGQALGDRPVHVLYNPHWPAGQASSLQIALSTLPPQSAGALFLAGDMPHVPPEHLDRMVERFRNGPTVVWSGGHSRRSIPALFGRESWPALMALQGDVGGRALAGRFDEATVAIAPSMLGDVDTVEDYELARQQKEAGPDATF